MHASAPVIAIWDDHEIANNPWMNGAEDHQAWEGDFHVRAAAAVRAFHEWLPTREPKPNGDSSGDASGDSGFAYNRSVHFGDVASFHVLETRLTARTNPNANPSGNVWANLTAEIGKFAESSRAPAAWPGSPLETRIQAIKANLDEYRDDEGETMAGPAQLSWLADEVSASADDGVAWQVVAQASPVMDHDESGRGRRCEVIGRGGGDQTAGGARNVARGAGGVDRLARDWEDGDVRGGWTVGAGGFGSRVVGDW